MNFKYHRKTLLASDTDHPLIKTAASMLDAVEKSMADFLQHRNTDLYIKEISAYDEFMYRSAKVKPQKSNPINTLQNKKYSTWREQKWAPIFESIRLELTKTWKTDKLVLIQNKKVAESVYSSGYIKYKDVDGGIGFEMTVGAKKTKVLVPIIAVEDKGGHACSTCFDGVAAQSLRLHRCFSNAWSVFITDNQITVGAAKESEIYNDIDLVVMERGRNRQKAEYPSLDATRFEAVRIGLLSRLKQSKLEDYTKYSEIQSSKSGRFREEIEKTGTLFNR